MLALVFGLSLVYFLTSTFKQVSGRSPSRVCSGRRRQLSRPPGFLPGPGRGLPLRLPCPCARAGGHSYPGTEGGRRDLLDRRCPGREGAARTAAGTRTQGCGPFRWRLLPLQPPPALSLPRRGAFLKASSPQPWRVVAPGDTGRPRPERQRGLGP